LDDLSEDESNYYRIAPEMFTGEMLDCADHILKGLEEIDNKYGVSFFECNKECAEKA
jgi:hypothetical protein